MITMEEFVDIRSLHKQGMSIRGIARKLGVHRATVKKYLRQDQAPPQYKKEKRRGSVLDPYHPTIDELLKEDAYQATWIHQRLQSMGYTGSYSTVKVYVRKVKGARQQVAYLRFETEPGCQAQVDWGDFQITETDGTTSTVYVFCMVLGYSRALYVEFVKRCTLETFLDCHMRAFAYLGGVPGEILYDRMKHVVIKTEKGETVFNKEILSFAAHYGFTPRACPAYSPWVKGKVERPMHYLREQFWRGYRYETLQRANEDVLVWLNETANQRIHGTYRRPVPERWEGDRSHLTPLPHHPYDTSLVVSRKVFKDCQIRYGGVPYVVPDLTLAGKRVTVKIKDTRLRIYHDDRLVAEYTLGRPDSGPSSTPWVGGHDFYQSLFRDLVQRQRKYGREKGKATRGLVNGTLYPEVRCRPLDEYERVAKRGTSWTS